jgi:hypothetical protein
MTAIACVLLSCSSIPEIEVNQDLEEEARKVASGEYEAHAGVLVSIERDDVDGEDVFDITILEDPTICIAPNTIIAEERELSRQLLARFQRFFAHGEAAIGESRELIRRLIEQEELRASEIDALISLLQDGSIPHQVAEAVGQIEAIADSSAKANQQLRERLQTNQAQWLDEIKLQLEDFIQLVSELQEGSSQAQGNPNFYDRFFVHRLAEVESELGIDASRTRLITARRISHTRDNKAEHKRMMAWTERLGLKKDDRVKRAPTLMAIRREIQMQYLRLSREYWWMPDCDRAEIMVAGQSIELPPADPGLAPSQDAQPESLVSRIMSSGGRTAQLRTAFVYLHDGQKGPLAYEPFNLTWDNVAYERASSVLTELAPELFRASGKAARRAAGVD